LNGTRSEKNPKGAPAPPNRRQGGTDPTLNSFAARSERCCAEQSSCFDRALQDSQGPKVLRRATGASKVIGNTRLALG